MLIQVKKFGTTLSSRPMGKEAYAAFLPVLREIGKEEKVDIDFDGVIVMGPSWADEFLTPILRQYGDRVSLLNTKNPSVKATLELLIPPSPQASS
ncbi:MAG: DUF4325 domain-containing protein [Candidatus Gracilibacteria bacterium]|jgi:hypothetical protein